MSKKTPFLLALFLLFASVGCGPKQKETTLDPCDGVECSGHGTCAVQQDVPVCICENGYLVDGLSCVKDPCDPNPCDEPPKPVCEDRQHVRAWDQDGECSVEMGAGVCYYGEGTLEDCYAQDKICVSGKCVLENTSPPAPGDLLITEILYDPRAVADEQGEFIELLNISANAVDLNGLVLSNSSDSDLPLSSETPLLLDAGAYFIIGVTADLGSEGALTADYVAEGLSLSNSGDTVQISYDEVVLDEVTYDNGGGFPLASGMSINLDPSAFNTASNDLGNNWCPAVIAFATGDLGTPGSSNSSCDNPCNPNPCDTPPAATCNGDTLVHPELDIGICMLSGETAQCDYGQQETDCTLSGQICDETQGKCTGAGSPPAPGDLVVTEIMKNPYIIDDVDGEWFEILNISQNEIDLRGLEVTDDGANTFVVSDPSPILLPPESYFVFGTNADTATNGGVTVDYEYMSLLLNNTEDGLTLTYGGQTIDEVHYDDGVFFPEGSGASLSLNPDHLSAADNDDGANWCEAQSSYHPNNNGTPGVENDACPTTDPCSPNPCTTPPDASCNGDIRNYPTLVPGTCTDNGGMAECDYGMATEDCSSSGMTCSNGQCVSSARPPVTGEIIITEIMLDPDVITDANGEWFEILNTTGDELDIQGLTVRDEEFDSFTLPTGAPIIVSSGAFFVLGRNGDPATNGGVSVDYTYGGVMYLGNGNDEVILELGGSTIDAVIYSDLSFPDTPGASMTLDPLHFNATDNDTGSNWCDGTSSYETNNTGTPGAPNDSCP